MTTVDTVLTAPRNQLIFLAGSSEPKGNLWDSITKRLNARPVYDDDPVWNALFAQSQDILMQMADEALAEYLAGRTEPLDPDNL